MADKNQSIGSIVTYSRSDTGTETHVEKPTVRLFTRGRDGAGNPITVEINRKEASEGWLNKRDALRILDNAEQGAYQLLLECESTEDARYFVLGTIAKLYKNIAQDVTGFPISEAQDEKDEVQRLLGDYKHFGITMETLITMAEIGCSMRAGEEFTRMAEVQRMERLARLGFSVGFGGVITHYYDREKREWIPFPETNLDLPEDKRWDDLKRRAEQLGILFDDQGRISGIKDPNSDDTIMIQENDRRPHRPLHFE